MGFLYLTTFHAKYYETVIAEIYCRVSAVSRSLATVMFFCCSIHLTVAQIFG